MLNLKPVKEEFYGYICRHCMNQNYHVDLRPNDCVLGETETCPFCRKDKQLVVGLRMGGRLKLLFK